LRSAGNRSRRWSSRANASLCDVLRIVGAEQRGEPHHRRELGGEQRGEQRGEQGGEVVGRVVLPCRCSGRPHEY
jgi:hypothetical protein